MENFKFQKVKELLTEVKGSKATWQEVADFMEKSEVFKHISENKEYTTKRKAMEISKLARYYDNKGNKIVELKLLKSGYIKF